MLVLLLKCAVATLALAVAGICGGTILGVILAALSFTRPWPARALYRLYVFLTRGTPLLVLALLVFYWLPAMNFDSGPVTAGMGLPDACANAADGTAKAGARKARAEAPSACLRLAVMLISARRD